MEGHLATELADRLLEAADAHAAAAGGGVGGDAAAAVQHYEQANRCLLASVGHATEAASTLTSAGGGAGSVARDSSNSAATKAWHLTQQADTHLDYALFCDRLLRKLKLKRQQRQGLVTGNGDDNGGRSGGAGDANDADQGLTRIGGGEDALTESVVSHLFDAMLAGTVFAGRKYQFSRCGSCRSSGGSLPSRVFMFVCARVI